MTRATIGSSSDSESEELGTVPLLRCSSSSAIELACHTGLPVNSLPMVLRLSSGSVAPASAEVVHAWVPVEVVCGTVTGESEKRRPFAAVLAGDAGDR